MLDSNAGVQAFIFSPPALPGSSGGLPIQYVLRTIGDSAQAFEIAERSQEGAVATGKLHRRPELDVVESPRARIIVDRDRAAALGVPVSEIGSTLGALVGGSSIGKFDRDNRSYDVVTQVSQENRLNPERLGQYYVRASNGIMVPLSSLVRIETERRRRPSSNSTSSIRRPFLPSTSGRDDERRSEGTSGHRGGGHADGLL